MDRRAKDPFQLGVCHCCEPMTAATGLLFPNSVTGPILAFGSVEFARLVCDSCRAHNTESWDPGRASCSASRRTTMTEASLGERTTQNAIFRTLERLPSSQACDLLLESLSMNSPDSAELKSTRETTLAGHLTGKCFRNTQQSCRGRKRQSDGYCRHLFLHFFAFSAQARLQHLRRTVAKLGLMFIGRCDGCDLCLAVRIHSSVVSSTEGVSPNPRSRLRPRRGTATRTLFAC